MSLILLSSSSMSKSATKSTNEEIFSNFQDLRSEQRLFANKLSELGMDLNEHKIVIETLRSVEPTRRCYRMVGGVLVERTVQDVLPELLGNVEQLPKAIRALDEQLARKGAEINEYIKNHDIRVQRIDQPQDAAPASLSPSADDADPPAKSTVLVPSA